MFHLLQPHEPMLLKTLKNLGYFVWWGGKNDVVAPQWGYDPYCAVKYTPPSTPERTLEPDLHSYNDWRGVPGSDSYYSHYFGRLENSGKSEFNYDFDQGMIEGAIKAIEQYANQADARPLCIYLALHHPHPPYGVEDPWYSLINPDHLPARIPSPNWQDTPGLLKPSILPGIHALQGLQDWTEDRWTDLRRTYYGMCSRVDAQLSLLIEALKEANLYDDSALFFFGDHGDFTGDYGLVEKTQNTFEDCLTRVPFVIKPPKGMGARAGSTDALVELIDFPATVFDVIGHTPDYSHFGQSLRPLLTGKMKEHRDAVFCQGGRLQGETHASELEHHQQDSLYYPRMEMQQRLPEHGKATMLRTKTHKYVHRLYEQDELYELQSDPQELTNRIDDPSLANVQTSLKRRLLRFYLETSDVVPHVADPRD